QEEVTAEPEEPLELETLELELLDEPLELEEQDLVAEASEDELEIPLLDDSLELEASDIPLETDDLPTLDSLPTLDEEDIPELMPEELSPQDELPETTPAEESLPELLPEELSLQDELPEPTLEIQDVSLEEVAREEDSAQPLEAASEPDSYMADLDPELAAIFLEEAADIIDRTSETIRQWTQQAGGQELVAEIQRDLHTLKGGARSEEH